MASFLTSQDLSAFLRSRPTANARIAADFVDDHPGCPVVAASVDRLEAFCWEVGWRLWSLCYCGFGGGTALSDGLGSPWGRCLNAGLDPVHQRAILPVLASLFPHHDLPPQGCSEPLCWQWCVARAGDLVRIHAPVWTSGLVRRLKRARISA